MGDPGALCRPALFSCRRHRTALRCPGRSGGANHIGLRSVADVCGRNAPPGRLPVDAHATLHPFSRGLTSPAGIRSVGSTVAGERKSAACHSAPGSDGVGPSRGFNPSANWDKDCSRGAPSPCRAGCGAATPIAPTAGAKRRRPQAKRGGDSGPPGHTQTQIVPTWQTPRRGVPTGVKKQLWNQKRRIGVSTALRLGK